jgi:hypothetical protein
MSPHFVHQQLRMPVKQDHSEKFLLNNNKQMWQHFQHQKKGVWVGQTMCIQILRYEQGAGPNIFEDL